MLDARKCIPTSIDAASSPTLRMRVSALIDQRSFVGKLYLKRVAQGAIPEELHPMVRYAVKKAE